MGVLVANPTTEFSRVNRTFHQRRPARGTVNGPPGDVRGDHDDRERRSAIASVNKLYDELMLQPVVWEDLYV